MRKKFLNLSRKTLQFNYVYDVNLPIKEKIETIAKRVYGADGVDFAPAANKLIAEYEKLGFGNLPICMAKNQYSMTDDATILGRPTGFRITIRILLYLPEQDLICCFNRHNHENAGSS